MGLCEDEFISSSSSSMFTAGFQSLFRSKEFQIPLCKIQAKSSSKVCMYIPESCFMFAVCSYPETDFGRIFLNSHNTSCPLTTTIKMKWSAPNSQMVVLGIASVPCCKNEGSAFLRILEGMITSCYILRVKIPHQQAVTLNRVHTTQLEQHLRSVFSF